MYVTLEGKKLSNKDIEVYNHDKFAFIIYRDFPYKLTHVNQFDDLDLTIDSYNKWVNNKEWEVRRRVSNSGCEILYCLVGEKSDIIEYNFTIPEPWQEIQAVDFKYFKAKNTNPDQTKFNNPIKCLACINPTHEFYDIKSFNR